MEENFLWMICTIRSISLGVMGRVRLCSLSRFITCVVNSLHACSKEMPFVVSLAHDSREKLFENAPARISPAPDGISGGSGPAWRGSPSARWRCPAGQGLRRRPPRLTRPHQRRRPFRGRRRPRRSACCPVS